MLLANGRLYTLDAANTVVDTLVTTWNTKGGWAVVREALTMGPRQVEDTVTPHTRPPVDEDGDHMLVRSVLCLEGDIEIELVCEPVFDYGRVPAEWTLVGDDRHTADASGRQVCRLPRRTSPRGPTCHGRR